ncbi:hypothetical protein B6N58_03240 [Legionella micdadei]|nr:hypothetical protein B6N58_03240 [Legionella micdadei]
MNCYEGPVMQHEKSNWLAFNLFQLKIIEVKKCCGVEQECIQGQLDEACSQTKMQEKALYWSN